MGRTVVAAAGRRRMGGEAATARGQISQSDLRVHFGPGAATGIDKLEVRWANGDTVAYAVPRLDAIYVIDQASGKVSAAAPVK